MRAFTEDWSRALCEELNDSAAYRQAAAAWEGSLLLELSGARAAEAAVYLDLHHGACREARPASAADREAATYVVAGDTRGWKSVLEGGSSPLTAIALGRLNLRRGSLSHLSRFTWAAQELVGAAARVTTELPD